jgi:hypothetical protein
MRRSLILTGVALSALLPAVALAQFDGLDLRKPKPKPVAPKRVDKPAPPAEAREDFSAGPVVLAVPPTRADGRPDADAFHLLHAALKERLGARLVSAEATLKAVDEQKLKGAALSSSAGLAKLAAAVKAERAVSFEVTATKLDAHVFAAPAGRSTADVSFAWPKKADLARARLVVDDLLKAGKGAFLPPALAEEPPLVALTPQPDAQEGTDDVGDERRRASGEVAQPEPAKPQGPLEPSTLVVLAGAGASFRTLRAVSDTPLVPQAPGAMAGLGFDLAFYPLRQVPSLAQGALADFSVEGYYRLNLAQAKVVGGPNDGATCKLSDDEVVARASYRYPLGGRLPRVGAAVGWASERTMVGECAAQALNTRYQSTEVHLKVLQPILGEQLALELAGGPRFVFSKHAAGFVNRSFSFEGWVTARPAAYLSLRAGARVTTTRLTTWPEGVSVNDVRSFIGLEAGAAL